MANNKEDQARIGFESGRSIYQVNYSFIYPSAAENVSEEFQKNIGWARYPRTDPDKPSKPPLGGINIGVGAFSEHKDLAFEAAQCLAQPKNQVVASELGGLPPTTESAYDDPKVKKALPFADLLRVSIEEGAPRPVNPAYSDISLAIQKTFHPPDSVEPGRGAVQARGPDGEGRRREDLLVEATAVKAPPTEAPKKGKLSERARSERKLAYMLCAPAILAMLVVTGYPIAYAFYLSLQKYDLRFPDDKEFVGLSNYADVLTSSTWWSDVGTTALITVASVSIELVIGMAIALVMHRAIFGRGPVRAAILIPYGIVTVVAAFAWRYAFDPTSGFLQSTFLLGDDAAPLTERGGSLVVIILTEVWKTTPFMALLLLAGLSLVPDELHEAAKVDGATTMQRFFRITLPLMKPAILVALLFRTLDAFRVFDSAFILTGGANGTETVSILGYNVLINRVNLGLGSAISVLIFIAVIVIATLLRQGARHEHGPAARGGLSR